MTFLAVLKLSLSDECVGFHKGRCPYNPFKKRTCCNENAALDFCADVAMLLVYHKTADTIADDRFFKRLAARLMMPIMRRNRRKAAQHIPELDAAIEQIMQDQRTLEQQKVASVDRAAEPTARMLSDLCAAATEEDSQKRVLARLGYCLGRWIYLMDAVDDLKDDLKNGSYNAIALSHGLTTPDDSAVAKAREQARFSLNASLAECRAAYDLLQVRRFGGILGNVFEWGMEQAQKQVLSDEKKASRRSGGLNDEQSV